MDSNNFDENDKGEGGKIPYIVIVPDPQVPNSYLMRNGQPGFFFKFGDAKNEKFIKRYRTHTPGHGLSWNLRCPQRNFMMTFKHVNPNTGEIEYEERSIRVGKTLEHKYMTMFLEGTANESEWWWITPNMNFPENTIEQLRGELHQLLLEFPAHDYWPLLANVNLEQEWTFQPSQFDKLMRSLGTSNNVYAVSPREKQYEVF